MSSLATLDRFRGVLGIAAILGLAFLLSENRRAISRRVVFWGLGAPVGVRDPGAVVAAGVESAGEGGGLRQGGAGYRARRLGDGLRPETRLGRRTGRVRVRVPRAADGHLRRGAIRGPLSPGPDAVDRPRLRLDHGAIDGGERRGIAERGGVPVHGADRGSADDPAVSAATDAIGIADRDDLGHGARLRRGHGRVFRRRRRAATHPDSRDHDGPRHDLAGQDARARDGGARDPRHRPRGLGTPRRQRARRGLSRARAEGWGWR